MKKFFIYFFVFIFVCFVLPALLTKRDINASTQEVQGTSETNTTQEETENLNNQSDLDTNYQYKNYANIKLRKFQLILICIV